MTERIEGAVPRTIILDEVTAIPERVFDAAAALKPSDLVIVAGEHDANPLGIDPARPNHDLRQYNVDPAEHVLDTTLIDPDPTEPEKPPFKIAHLELPDIFRTIGAVLPLTKGRPANIETMDWAFRPIPPPNLPDGVTPDIALDCVLWAIDINNQRKADKARHMAAGATIGYGAHLVKSRFKIAGKRLLGRKQMWRPSRKQTGTR